MRYEQSKARFGLEWVKRSSVTTAELSIEASWDPVVERFSGVWTTVVDTVGYVFRQMAETVGGAWGEMAEFIRFSTEWDEDLISNQVAELMTIPDPPAFGPHYPPFQPPMGMVWVAPIASFPVVPDSWTHIGFLSPDSEL